MADSSVIARLRPSGRTDQHEILGRWELQGERLEVGGVLRVLDRGVEVTTVPTGPGGAVRALACTSALDPRDLSLGNDTVYGGPSWLIVLFDVTRNPVAVLQIDLWVPELLWLSPVDASDRLDVFGFTALLETAGVELRVITSPEDRDLRAFQTSRAPTALRPGPGWELQKGPSYEPGRVQVREILPGLEHVGADLVVRQGKREAWFPLGGPAGLTTVALVHLVPVEDREPGHDPMIVELRGAADAARVCFEPAALAPLGTPEQAARTIAATLGLRLDLDGHRSTVRRGGVLDATTPTARPQARRGGMLGRLFGR